MNSYKVATSGGSKTEGVMEGDYQRRVLKGAWSKTLNLLGWSRQKAVSGAALLVGTVLFGGATAGFNLITSSISVVAGLLIVGAVVFLWGIFETQREMYLDCIGI
jgi:hypothetical protein